jgi:G3E family GTPase
MTLKTLRSDRRLPVTLLSGFLGAGKTTLLERILTTAHDYRIGVIVNDMSVLNIDAALLTNHKVHQEKERIIELQNGCICCTLRGDLLEEVVRMAENGRVDYLVIESSGISEPMQVAEAFSVEFAEMHAQAGVEMEHELLADRQQGAGREKMVEILKKGGLSTLSRLDTCVTVVDAANVFNDFNTTDFLADRHGKAEVPDEDDRNVSDLQVDQIEFANVVIVNKCDLVNKAEVDKIKQLIKTLNPSAKLLTSVKSDVDIGQLLNTGLFDYEKAALGAGWLRSLHEEMKPETEEYGISSFVFRARRPFAPRRLWNLIKENFVVIQEEFIDDGMDEEGDTAMSDSGESDTAQLDLPGRLASKKASAVFGPLLRSKGFFWLATRPTMFGEWSQAGVMLTLSGGDKWRCEIPEEEWPADKIVRQTIRRDFQGAWGDRRQEIVLIGMQLNEGGRQNLENAFSDCLLNNEEWSQWETIMNDTKTSTEEKTDLLQEAFEDGFEDWNDQDLECTDDHHGHSMQT